MRILFVHQNFPGQFLHLAAALAGDPANEVLAMTMRRDASKVWRGVRLFPYQPARSSTAAIHPWVRDMEAKVIRGEAAFERALALRAQGFTPDLIIAHPGWGESLFLKDVWPQARLGIYCEFYYRNEGADVGFDPEFAAGEASDACRLRMKNVNALLHFESADGAISPTHWQASTFPAALRERITVAHDGIDCDAVAPDPAATLTLDDGTVLTRADEVITFVNRNLEPYRGYHIFMRALPALLARRPHAQVLIVGTDDVSYGSRPPAGKTWKSIFFDEVKGQLNASDLQRVHFLGNIAYRRFVALLQISRVHVYLTYPFVLSWSLLEAMSAGCAIVASDTAPLREAITHDVTGMLVPFFDGAALTDQVCALLDDTAARTRLGQSARAFARANYDLKTICLPAQLAWVRKLME
ncbi:MAG: glycosyltransferase family 4 protein [Pseudomonadota bacterium]